MALPISSLSPEHVGRWVRYTPHFGNPELGRIKIWNHHAIFVVYKCDGNWNLFFRYTAAATDPNDLELMAYDKDWRPPENHQPQRA